MLLGTALIKRKWVFVVTKGCSRIKLLFFKNEKRDSYWYQLLLGAALTTSPPVRQMGLPDTMRGLVWPNLSCSSAIILQSSKFYFNLFHHPLSYAVSSTNVCCFLSTAVGYLLFRTTAGTIHLLLLCLSTQRLRVCFGAHLELVAHCNLNRFVNGDLRPPPTNTPFTPATHATAAALLLSAHQTNKQTNKHFFLKDCTTSAWDPF